MVGRKLGDHAVVLGASMAGLLAARLLADAYHDVTLVERDALSGVPEPRRAVPQGPHIHGLLAKGQQALEELFPGFTKELAASGVPVGDFGTSLSWYFKGRMIKKTETGLVCISAGRPLLEEEIRDRVRALSNVRFLDGADIVGVVASDDRQRLTGVRVQRQVDGSAEEVLPADLVVDATGRGSRTPRWLVELGYSEVSEERVKI